MGSDICPCAFYFLFLEPHSFVLLSVQIMSVDEHLRTDFHANGGYRLLKE